MKTFFLNVLILKLVTTIHSYSYFYTYFFNRSTDPSLNGQLTEVYAQLQNIESDKAPAKASIILNGLGFTTEMQQNATKTFSGGWRMRLALARALFSR